ncbi:MAG: J domain-containing protein [Hyphomicrobiaceae bacterium]
MFAKGDGFRDVEPCLVDITLTNNANYSGTIQRPRSKTLHEYLNSEIRFVEVELFTGAVMQVNKAAIASCEQRDLPRADQLALSIRRADVYQPYGTLGVDMNASKEQVREAYRTRMRLYHGDRYANIELPHEVVSYLDDMAKRVNAAYRDAMAAFVEPEPEVKPARRPTRAF